MSAAAGKGKKCGKEIIDMSVNYGESFPMHMSLLLLWSYSFSFIYIFYIFLERQLALSVADTLLVSETGGMSPHLYIPEIRNSFRIWRFVS